MHETVERNMREGTDECASDNRRYRPGFRRAKPIQSAERQLMIPSTETRAAKKRGNDGGYECNEERSQVGVCDTMQHRGATHQSNKRFKIHHHLGNAKREQAEAVACHSLDGQTRSHVKWCEWHDCSAVLRAGEIKVHRVSRRNVAMPMEITDRVTAAIENQSTHLVFVSAIEAVCSSADTVVCSWLARSLMYSAFCDEAD